MAVIGALVGAAITSLLAGSRGRCGGRGRGANGQRGTHRGEHRLRRDQSRHGQRRGPRVVHRQQGPGGTFLRHRQPRHPCPTAAELDHGGGDQADRPGSLEFFAVSPATGKPAWWGRSPSTRSVDRRARQHRQRVTIGREKMMEPSVTHERSRHLRKEGRAVVPDPPCRGPVPRSGRRVRTQHPVRSRTRAREGDLPTIIGIRALSGPFSATLGGTLSPPSAGCWSPHAPSTQLPACGYGRDDGAARVGTRIYPLLTGARHRLCTTRAAAGGAHTGRPDHRHQPELRGRRR